MQVDGKMQHRLAGQQLSNANNNERWCSPEYDAKFAELQAATDPAERAGIAIELNDMLAQNYVNMPLVFRASVSAYAN